MSDDSDNKSFMEKFKEGREEVQKELEKSGGKQSDVSFSEEKIGELVAQAESDTVTVDRLLGKEQYFHNVLSFFEDGEQPEFLFPLTKGLLADPALIVESGAEREELIGKADGGSVAITDRYVRVHSRKGEWTIPYTSIVSVDFVGHPALHIQTAGRTYYIKIAGTHFDEEQSLSEAASYIRNKQQESEKQPNESETQSDPLDRLEKLNQLKEAGALSQSEFQEKKEELLDQI
ncbi:SHOCT domain-containing protein [Haloarcula sediminis]|uniref:SHOCT domain-containing protein n=1 Tax=Haloarcula sediminis TaxID=3111777 RepID=UPI002D796891|nr:SHOCT domain-containing protein [Haloarcula sp. CK38]